MSQIFPVVRLEYGPAGGLSFPLEVYPDASQVELSDNGAVVALHVQAGGGSGASTLGSLKQHPLDLVVQPLGRGPVFLRGARVEVTTVVGGLELRLVQIGHQVSPPVM